MTESKKEKSGLLRFLRSKTFFKNLALAIIAAGILFFILVKYLDYYTMQGDELVVPNFYGKTLAQLDSAEYNKYFDFYVIDSMYDDSNRKGAVVIQNPVPGSKVKKGRNIYFTIVASTPEMVTMPDLRDLTLRQAINILESNKLKTGKLIYQPSFDKNAVLEQMFDNDTIMPGDTIPRGSVIDLVIGSGERNYPIPVPFLIGKTRDEAIYELNTASFNLGNEFFMDSVTDKHARVYMQDPRWDSDISHFPGDSIYLWYKSDELFDFDAYLQTFSPDSLKADSLAPDTTMKF